MSLLDSFLLEDYRINVWVAARTDGIKGSGTIGDPYDGSSLTKFDQLMRDFAAITTGTVGVRVNLGPGIFQTLGYYDGISGSTGWQPSARMKIVGSGIGVTKTLESSSPASGIPLSGSSSNNPLLYPLTFRRYLVRENIVRHFEGKSDPNRVDAIHTNNCEKGIVQHNIIAVNPLSEPKWLLAQSNNGTVAFSDNQNASGQSIKPYSNVPQVFTDDARRGPIEDATTMAFL